MLVRLLPLSFPSLCFAFVSPHSTYMSQDRSGWTISSVVSTSLRESDTPLNSPLIRSATSVSVIYDQEAEEADGGDASVDENEAIAENIFVKSFTQGNIELDQDSVALQSTRQQVELLDKTKKGEIQLIEANENGKLTGDGPSGRKTFVVVGAGWGGWGAAKALCQANADVILIDTLPDPTGRTPYMSTSEKPVEAGTRGFWKDYPNIYALCDELGLSRMDVFTDFTNSSFYSPDGLEATAPVFGNATFPSITIPLLSNLSHQKLPTLPSPLGQVLATFPLFERLPLADRASMIGLLVATVDCWAGNESVRSAYDRMTAHELFVRFGLSDRLVADFVKPTLLVGLFKPPHELSALVVMELLYYYALAHVDSFDVRWIRNGTVADSLIRPLADELEGKYRLKVLGGCRVGKITTHCDSDGAPQVQTIEYTNNENKATKTIENIDGIVLAVTAKGMKNIVDQSPDLATHSFFTQASSLGGIDVISVRLWLDRYVHTRTPANVFAGFDELRGAGGTFFMLDQLQSESLASLWGDSEAQGSVVACDFYNAGTLMSLPDNAIVDMLLRTLLPSAVPAFANANAVDIWIGRFPGGVTWFSPGSYNKRPTISTPIANVKCAGDWVRLGSKLEEQSAKGLCQERAYSVGLHAANVLLKECGCSESVHEVLPVREDEPQFRAAIQVNQEIMKFVPRFWLR